MMDKPPVPEALFKIQTRVQAVAITSLLGECAGDGLPVYLHNTKNKHISMRIGAETLVCFVLSLS